MKKAMVRLVCLILIFALTAVGASAAQWWDPLAVERQIYTYLTGELKLNSAAACGVLANIEYESAFQVTIVGDQGTSFGLCQWHNERYSALRGYCLARGLDYKTVEGQMAYLSYELKTGYASLYGALRSVENSPEGAYTAAYLWCVRFERPADMERKAAERGNKAKYKYWNRYNSLSMLAQEETTPDPEVVAEELRQEDAAPITMPEQNVQTRQTENGRRYVAPKLEKKAYVNHHSPQPPPGPTGANGVAMGMLFMPMSDGLEHGYRLPRPEESEEDAGETEKESEEPV